MQAVLKHHHIDFLWRGLRHAHTAELTTATSTARRRLGGARGSGGRARGYHSCVVMVQSRPQPLLSTAPPVLVYVCLRGCVGIVLTMQALITEEDAIM